MVHTADFVCAIISTTRLCTQTTLVGMEYNVNRVALFMELSAKQITEKKRGHECSPVAVDVLFFGGSIRNFRICRGGIAVTDALFRKAVDNTEGTGVLHLDLCFHPDSIFRPR